MSTATGQVARHFDREARRWRDVYSRTDVFAQNVQHRHALALDWIGRLGLPPRSVVLEVGSGAGVLSVELARRGLAVYAMEISAAMLALSRKHAQQAGPGDRVQFVRADAHRLPVGTGHFDLVVALGLLQWTQSPRAVLAEMAAALRPGGFLLVQAGNKARMDWMLDPYHNLLLRPFRHHVRHGLRPGRSTPRPRVRDVMHSADELRLLLEAAGLERVDAATSGFGPFTLLGRRVLPDLIGTRVQRGLQYLADRRAWGVRALGNSHLVLCRKVV